MSNIEPTNLRQQQFALWLLIHSPRHSDLETFFNTDADVLHHDLNWMATFLKPFDLVVDPSMDQRMAIYGRETNICRTIQELLGAVRTADHQTRYVLVAPNLEPKLAQKTIALGQIVTFETNTWQSVYDYLWTLAMRYQYGR